MSTEDTFRPPVDAPIPVGQNKFAPGDVDPETPDSEEDKSPLERRVEALERYLAEATPVDQRVDALERNVAEMQQAQQRDAQQYAEYMQASNAAMDALRRSIGPGMNAIGSVGNPGQKAK